MSNLPVNLITTPEALEAAVRHLAGVSVIGVDTETTGLDPLLSDVRLAQIATPEQTFVIDLFEIDAFNDPALREMFAAPQPIKIFHHAKFDVKMLLHHFNLEVYGIFDTMLASQLISAGRSEGGNSLAAVTARYLNQELDKSLQLSDWSGKLSKAQYEYAALDVQVLLPLREQMAQKLDDLKMTEVAKLEFDCVLPLAAMELAGMYLDAECWRKLVAETEREHQTISADLKRQLAAGIEQLSLFDEPTINLDSPTQVTEALGRMGI